VLAKSLHLMAVGWMASVIWLWDAQIAQNVRRFAVAPDGYGVRTLAEGAVPAILIEAMAIGMAVLIARVPGTGDARREWWHAFWWTVVPNVLVIGTAYLMILEGR
jgi:hypothetical protein